MDCELLCISCSFTQLYKVNFAYYHGLCEEHKTPTEKAIKCVHCQSIVPILCLSDIKPCTNCLMNSQKVFKNCSHTACENCFLNECSKCSTLCNFCLKSKGSKLKKCSHLLCKDCLSDTNLPCPLCESPNDDLVFFCDYCSENFNVISDKECKHKICEKCYKGLDKCPLCAIQFMTKDVNEERLFNKDVIVKLLKPQDIEKFMELPKSAEKNHGKIQGKIEKEGDEIQIESLQRVSTKFFRRKIDLNFDEVNKNSLANIENASLLADDSETLAFNTQRLNLNSSPDLATRKKNKSKTYASGKLDVESLHLAPKGNYIEKSFHGNNIIISTEVDDNLHENKSESLSEISPKDQEIPAPQVRKPMPKFLYFVSCCLCCGHCDTESHNSPS